MTRGRLIAGLVVAVGYIVTGFWLYRQRVMSVATLWDSDLLVLALPFAMAFVGFALVFWPRDAPDLPVPSSRARAVVLAGIATGVSACVYMVVAFNLYGT